MLLNAVAGNWRRGKSYWGIQVATENRYPHVNRMLGKIGHWPDPAEVLLTFF